jgi:hypothetical protein
MIRGVPASILTLAATLILQRSRSAMRELFAVVVMAVMAAMCARMIQCSWMNQRD